MRERCSLTPNLYMALNSLVAEIETANGRPYAKAEALKRAISRICGFSDCYCDNCNYIAKKYYDVDHYEDVQTVPREELEGEA